MGKTLTDWFRWFTRRTSTSEARTDVANSNLASIRLMGSFVIALETITLAYVLLVPEGQIQSRTASAMSLVSRSWICRRAARQSTIRAILLTPSTRPREM